LERWNTKFHSFLVKLVLLCYPVFEVRVYFTSRIMQDILQLRWTFRHSEHSTS